MPKKIRDVLKILHNDGWYLNSQRGSHRQLEHPQKLGKLTVSGKPSDELDDSAWKKLQT